VPGAISLTETAREGWSGQPYFALSGPQVEGPFTRCIVRAFSTPLSLKVPLTATVLPTIGTSVVPSFAAVLSKANLQLPAEKRPLTVASSCQNKGVVYV
jgi:hypothetical protein